MAEAEKSPNPMAVIRHELSGMEGQFKAALPAHIPVERFTRVIMTAIQNNPDLVKARRQTIWNAAMRAAQDGLLPDGREGAIVVYGEVAQWMPMIAGLRKKVRNSGEIATWDAQVVHESDNFEYELGDDPFIRHKPSLLANPGKVIVAYSIATLKGGEKSREVMSIAQIEAVRDRSKAKNSGPWKTDYDEMCRKTVARRHSKVLPMSTDLDDLIRRDDDLYDLQGAKEEARIANGGRPHSLAGKLDALASVGSTIDAVPQQVDASTIADDQSSTSSESTQQQAAVPEKQPPAATPAPQAIEKPAQPRRAPSPSATSTKQDPAPAASAYDPEKVRAAFQAAATKAKDRDELNDAYERHVGGIIDDLFPSDKDDLNRIYDLRAAEVDGQEGAEP